MDQALIAIDFHQRLYASSSLRGLLICSMLCEKVAVKVLICTVFLDFFFLSGNSYEICIFSGNEIVCDG